jgi:hypothetical protein
MGASNSFQNIWPLSQNQTPRSKHKHRDDHDLKEWWMFPRNTADHLKASENEDRESTEPKDKKTRHSTSIEMKQGPKSQKLKPTGDKST